MSHDAVVLNYRRGINEMSGVKIAVALRKSGYDKPIVILSNNSADSIRGETGNLVDENNLTLVNRASGNKELYLILQSSIADYNPNKFTSSLKEKK
jgi:hypothetical protein